MTAPDGIQQLVRHFDEQRATFHAEKYKETQVRSDFLDPFFEALGWDIANKDGAQIDRLVDVLYGLTEEEIKIVEG